MQLLDFFTIVERDRDILNPIGPEGLDRVAEYAGLQDGDRVLDLGCGRGAMLRQWASYNAISGVGVDLNPAFVYGAQSAAGHAGPNERLTFLEGDVRALQPDPDGYDLVTCLGATSAFGGCAETLQAMQALVRPGGGRGVPDR